MAARACTLLFAAAVAAAVLAPHAAAQDTVNLYGLTMPVLQNYLNWTIDISEIQRFTAQGKFQDAAPIYYNGKNNRRNATLTRKMADFSRRNLTSDGPEGWWALYSTHFKSGTYLNDLLAPPLAASYGFSCCGMRDAALRIYLRLWQVAYAQHEMDAGIASGEADEAVHGFAILASPYSIRDNYWNWVRSNSLAACLPDEQDSIVDGVGTTEKWPAANLAYRNLAVKMEKAINAQDVALMTATRAELLKTVAVQFLQAVMVNAKKATGRASGLERSACYNVCGFGPYQAAASAAWTSISPIVARAAPAAQAAIDALPELLVSSMLTTNFAAIRSNVATVAAALGINFDTQVYRCSS